MSAHRAVLRNLKDLPARIAVENDNAVACVVLLFYPTDAGTLAGEIRSASLPPLGITELIARTQEAVASWSVAHKAQGN